RARQLLGADLGRDRHRDAGAGRRRGARRAEGDSRVRFPISKHRLWQVGVDAGLIAAAWYLAFQLRFDHGVPIYYETLFNRSVGIVVGIQLATFLLFGFYNRWWRYVSTRDM